jgi:hypothetical protein
LETDPREQLNILTEAFSLKLSQPDCANDEQNDEGNRKE